MGKNYSDEYACTHDIDLICLVDGKPSLVASNGCSIATEFNIEENERNIGSLIQSESCNIEVNTNIVDVIINNSIFLTDEDLGRLNYISSFCLMARKGLYSYDIVGFDNEKYLCALIAYPLDPQNTNNALLGLKTFDSEIRIMSVEDLKSYYDKRRK